MVTYKKKEKIIQILLTILLHKLVLKDQHSFKFIVLN